MVFWRDFGAHPLTATGQPGFRAKGTSFLRTRVCKHGPFGTASPPLMSGLAIFHKRKPSCRAPAFSVEFADV